MSSDEGWKSSAGGDTLAARLREVRRTRGGFRYPFAAFRVVRKRLMLHLRRWFHSAFRSGTFTLEGTAYPYFFHVYNRTWMNERAVELPVVWKHVQERSEGRILEVGNVLSHYFRVRHDILDKYEPGPGVLNEDVVSFRPDRPYDLVVSISTLEHVGWDEDPREEEKVGRALEHLRGLLAPGGRMVVTVPLGHNGHLDRLIREGRTGFDRILFMKRVSARNRWEETSWDDVKDVRYGSPYRAANGLVIGIVEKSPAADPPPSA